MLYLLVTFPGQVTERWEGLIQPFANLILIFVEHDLLGIWTDGHCTAMVKCSYKIYNLAGRERHILAS